jgi:hypothetical protein
MNMWAWVASTLFFFFLVLNKKSSLSCPYWSFSSNWPSNSGSLFVSAWPWAGGPLGLRACAKIKKTNSHKDIRIMAWTWLLISPSSGISNSILKHRPRGAGVRRLTGRDSQTKNLIRHTCRSVHRSYGSSPKWRAPTCLESASYMIICARLAS